MLTMEDCLGLADLEAEEVAQIAAHEHLPFMTALEKGASLLQEPWGDAAVRQMVWDNLYRRPHNPAEAASLMTLYNDTCTRHPNPFDRRTSPARAAGPQRRH
ncbi:hypothetical protein A6A40_01155 [Azospirillum humicireducens]|uniref:Uncharacterized protein n=1 Tax=Azospirillum humicireducens TaxID=1226968 RepID=A0A160JDB4_9PROT|nr:hypothetical protein [Azospirillum humicireducens]ANC90626.2 hypothetical protein A6A40_01155 [Azospirillum humicireducens]